jgi:hypothetical protein
MMLRGVIGDALENTVSRGHCERSRMLTHRRRVGEKTLQPCQLCPVLEHAFSYRQPSWTLCRRPAGTDPVEL